MPDFTCDLTQTGARLEHVWETVVGSGHAALALRSDWQAQLKRARQELGFQHVRFHGILSDDVGTFTIQQDEPVYSFFNADQIMDFLVSINMRPFVELSFMPNALASGNKTVFHYQGNVTPPQDYGQWATLMGKLVAHWLERYGIEEVRTWFFEVWNEPNLQAFWTGTQADYFKLYQHTVTVIKEVDEQLRVGGPATANNEWIAEFLSFCHEHKLPADFVSTHHYPTDAFGKPGDDTEAQLAAATRGVLLERAQNSRRQAQGKPLYYTEWSTSSNPFFQRHDEPYAAAFVTKAVLDVAHTVQGYSYWTFSDIFEENYFSSVPFHGGFGLLSIHGIAKPTYRAFELLHRLGNEQLLVDGLHNTVNAWVVRKEDAVTILLTNHALPQHPIEQETVHLTLTGALEPHSAHVERIDETHANPRRLWETLGKPNYLNESQLEQLHRASELTPEPQAWHYEDGTLRFDLELPPHAVAAVTVGFKESNPAR